MSAYDPAAVMVAVARLVEITPLSRSDLTPLIVAVRREVGEEIALAIEGSPLAMTDPVDSRAPMLIQLRDAITIARQIGGDSR